MINPPRKPSQTQRWAACALFFHHHLRHGINRGAKRALDLVCGLPMVLLLSPLLIITALTILIVDGRPITFAGSRVGKNGRLFPMMKFRTMRRDAEAIEKKIQQHKIN